MAVKEDTAFHLGPIHVEGVALARLQLGAVAIDHTQNGGAWEADRAGSPKRLSGLGWVLIEEDSTRDPSLIHAECGGALLLRLQLGTSAVELPTDGGAREADLAGGLKAAVEEDAAFYLGRNHIQGLVTFRWIQPRAAADQLTPNDGADETDCAGGPKGPTEVDVAHDPGLVHVNGVALLGVELGASTVEMATDGGGWEPDRAGETGEAQVHVSAHPNQLSF